MADIGITNALIARVSRYVLKEPQVKSIFWQLMGSEGSDEGVRTPGVKIGGYQGKTINLRDKAHLTFTMRNRSHASPTPIPSGATMKDNAEKFDYATVSGTREIFAKSLSTTAFAISQTDLPIIRDAIEELRDFVEITPYDVQFCHALAPTRATIASKSAVTYDDTGSLWYALRTASLAAITTTLDLEYIGYPSGSGNAPSANTEVRVGFLSKAAGDILAHPNGAWSDPTDDMAPTVNNLSGYKRYLRRQGYREPSFKLFGQSYTGFLTIVEENFFADLALDPRWEDIQNWIEPRGPNNTVLEGLPRVLKLHGMYFVALQQTHDMFDNGTPLYSVNYGTGDRAVYCGMTVTRNCWMTSLYEQPKFTRYEADHEGYAPQVGAYIIIGSKILTDIRAATPEATVAERNRVAHMVYTARRGN